MIVVGAASGDNFSTAAKDLADAKNAFYFYDTFKDNLTQLKVSKKFKELDLTKRKWIFENTYKLHNKYPSQITQKSTLHQKHIAIK